MQDTSRVAIIGGGIIGCLTGWFLREAGFAGAITIIERDPTYRFSSTALSAASIRTQFACPVNVSLSLFGSEFLRSIQNRLDPEADIGLVQNGYLILASAPSAEMRRAALAMQQSLGAKVVALDRADLATRFPWLNSEQVELATLGTADEGWFDAWALLQAARRAALRRDVAIIQAEASGFETDGGRIEGVRMADGSSLQADWCVNAAGPLSGKVARWLGIALPVAPKKRTVFHFRAPLSGKDMPMLFDISGAWMRPEGEGFIGGIQPAADADPDAGEDFEPDHYLFEDRVWPLLAARVPALEQIRLLNAWAGHYEMNLFDHNGVVGPHPDLPNFLFATGFSGHGIMHAPGVARAIAEHVVHGRYTSIDVGPLGFGRIAADRPMPESAIY
ncbi:NAD(P)/FAD-dependent oxidoreductase [Sphingosinicella rhizophila]|uniref:FAD-binding oxidoreductase n=1 Tax=Sphingosinicella rhizophila TaxID=3050082 RepID=A0ABU3Q5T8_9SPHN|nr:FAD-binding oxidoreductase [Sphingosinicella sp. GR2756]MDT9598773.1 FAD-binding oxidoreductase [Sphingosinicella sp. GR2756]